MIQHMLRHPQHVLYRRLLINNLNNWQHSCYQATYENAKLWLIKKSIFYENIEPCNQCTFYYLFNTSLWFGAFD